MRLTICKASYGSRPWFAVPEGTVNPSGPDAVWLVGGPSVIQTQDGPVTTDGRIRFCAKKSDLMAAITKSGHVAAWRTLHNK